MSDNDIIIRIADAAERANRDTPAGTGCTGVDRFARSLAAELRASVKAEPASPYPVDVRARLIPTPDDRCPGCGGLVAVAEGRPGDVSVAYCARCVLFGAYRNAVAPVPRGHCGRCDRCGRVTEHTDTGACLTIGCTRDATPRTHCAGCGAPYQFIEPRKEGDALASPDDSSRTRPKHVMPPAVDRTSTAGATAALVAGAAKLLTSDNPRGDGKPPWTDADIAAVVADEMAQPGDTAAPVDASEVVAFGPDQAWELSAWVKAQLRAIPGHRTATLVDALHAQATRLQAELEREKAQHFEACEAWSTHESEATRLQAEVDVANDQNQELSRLYVDIDAKLAACRAENAELRRQLEKALLRVRFLDAERHHLRSGKHKMKKEMRGTIKQLGSKVDRRDAKLAALTRAVIAAGCAVLDDGTVANRRAEQADKDCNKELLMCHEELTKTRERAEKAEAQLRERDQQAEAELPECVRADVAKAVLAWQADSSNKDRTAPVLPQEKP